MKSHCLRNDGIGPFGVAETRSQIQKKGGHCLSQASLPAAGFGEQRKNLSDHAEGRWFWVLLPKQKDLGPTGTNPGNRIKEKESDAVADRMHRNIQD